VTATFKDHKGGRASVKVNNPPGFVNFMTMNDAASFGRDLAAYSRAGLEAVSVQGYEFIGEYPDGFWEGATQTGEHYDLCEQKLALYYRVKGTGKMISIQVPAPNDNCFQDQIVKASVAEDIGDIIGACSNYESSELVPVRGGMKSKLKEHSKEFYGSAGV
jgi:hypothetical protein